MKNNVNFLAFVVALGGFLFGYDTAIISGTIGFVNTEEKICYWYLVCSLPYLL